MKYSFDGFVGKNNEFHKIFKSREKANKYLEKVLEKQNVEVNEILIKNKHCYEYICNNYTRFSISRTI